MINADSFRKAGHAPTLFSSFLYFDISFMIWLLCGGLSLYITKDFGLNDFQKALMVAIPLLGGALLRIPMGILADKIGCRKTALIGMALTFLPLGWGLFFAQTLPEIYLVGLLLGVPGASFGVALPLASRWYPPKYQGLAMGIAGAGNSGTALATLFAPPLAELFGWHVVFGLAMIPLAITYVVFFILAKDSPTHPAPKKWGEYFAIFKETDAWWFCLFYFITFGGFSALASYFGIVFYDIYGEKAVAGGLTKVQIGFLTTAVVVAGSIIRPVGGWIADKIGGMKFLTGLFVTLSLLLFVMSSIPPTFILALLVAIPIMASLGMGNGAVFQLVPQRFGKEVGIATGIIGAAGGLGGFFLPTVIFGPLKQLTGSHMAGFLTFGALAAIVTVVFYMVTHQWRKGWAAEADAEVNF